MAALTAALVIGGLTTAAKVATDIAANKQLKRAANAEQEAVNLQRKQNDLQAARQRRDAVRASRLAYATAQTAAANQGATGTSASQGGLGSIISQGNDNVSFLDAFSNLSDQASMALGRAAVFKSNAAQWNAAGDIIQTAGSFGVKVAQGGYK